MWGLRYDTTSASSCGSSGDLGNIDGIMNNVSRNNSEVILSILSIESIGTHSMSHSTIQPDKSRTKLGCTLLQCNTCQHVRNQTVCECSSWSIFPRIMHHQFFLTVVQASHRPLTNGITSYQPCGTTRVGRVSLFDLRDPCL